MAYYKPEATSVLHPWKDKIDVSIDFWATVQCSLLLGRFDPLQLTHSHFMMNLNLETPILE